MMKKSTKKYQARAHTTSGAEADSPSLLALHIGKSLLITVLSGGLLTLVCSLAAYFYADPDQLILPLALAACGLSAMIGGFAAVRLHGHGALLCGSLNGLAATALMILVSLFLKPYAFGYSAAVSCILHVAFLALSIAGAYLGLRRPQKRKKRKI